MKKKENVPQETSERPVSNVRSYFTKEINDLIVGMSTKEMESIMKDLITTRHWIAILKYTSMRTPLLDSQLRTINPIKDPHTISWAQGAMAGLCDIENYVIDLSTPSPAPEETNNDQFSDGSPEGVIMG